MESDPLILLTGANGQVGHEVSRLARERGVALAALNRTQLDITDAQAVNKAVSHLRPSLLINAAAYTAVDKAEEEEGVAFAVNREGTANLAAACAENIIPLIHLSTDYVFDGCQQTPYGEDDPAKPTGIYGLSKLQGETALRQRSANHLILRVSWVFGAHGHNFVKTILRLGRQRDELRVVADQHGCPTAAVHIAETLLDLSARILEGEMIPWGTYHYCGQPATTWYGFAKEIVKQAQETELIDHPVTVQPISTSDYPTPAARPANSVLDCSKITETFGILPSLWHEGLREMIRGLRTEDCEEIRR